MDQASLQKKYDQLLAAVRKMRTYQKLYFAHKASVDLDKAKYHERHVDHLVGLCNENKKIKDSNQKELF